MNCRNYIRHLERGAQSASSCVEHRSHCNACDALTAKVEASLSSASLQANIPVNPFFYTRLEQRIMGASAVKQRLSGVRVLAGMAAVFLLTVVVAFSLMYGLRSTSVPETSGQNTQLSTLIYEYSSGEQNMNAWEELYYENNE